MVTKAKGSAALFWYCSQGAASLLHPLAQQVLTIATTLRKISHQLEAQKAAPEEICRDSVCSYIFKVESLPVRDTSQHFHFFWESNLLKPNIANGLGNIQKISSQSENLMMSIICATFEEGPWSRYSIYDCIPQVLAPKI